MKERLQQICDGYGCVLKTDVPLSRYTTFRIGGTADYWAEVNSISCLRELLSFCRSESVPYFVLGRGSNILASDEGYRGVILHLGSAFADVEVFGSEMTCQAGAILGNVARTAASLGLGGLEALGGIPGTVGGALYMNAGAYGSEMKDVVLRCVYINPDGELCTLERSELELSYRHSVFSGNGGIIVSVTLALSAGNSEEIQGKMEELLNRRKLKQPLEYPSAGSTFKRPEGSYASLLIDECGLKGLHIGGAQVSEKHAGFIVNKGGATCRDVLELCRQVQDTVKEKTGFTLELEPIVLK